MAIDDNTTYGLTGAQVKDLANKINSAGGVRTLSAEDYDIPTDNPQAIAIWNLDEGFYAVPSGVNLARSYYNGNVYDVFSNVYGTDRVSDSIMYVTKNERYLTQSSQVATDGTGYKILTSKPNSSEYVVNWIVSGVIKSGGTSVTGASELPLKSANVLTIQTQGYLADARALATLYSTKLDTNNLQAGTGATVTVTGTGAARVATVSMDTSVLAPVATSGSYTDLTDQPTVPVITMTTTDPGEGSPLAANHFIGVYQ